MTSRIIRTESGSVYEVEGGRIRRHNGENILEQDDQWLRLLAPLPPRNLVGFGLHLLTDHDILRTSPVIADTWEAA